MDDPKCDACNRVENLKPCGFCGQPVIIRYNTMTGEHYISHEDWNSRCPQRPFYGGAEQWNNRHTEDVLRAEIIQWITANNAAIVLINEQQTEIIRLRAELAERDEAHRCIIAEPCAPDEHHCTCVPALRAEIERLRTVLKAVEWLSDYAGVRWCPSCSCRWPEHASGCQLKAALDAAGGE